MFRVEGRPFTGGSFFTLEEAASSAAKSAGFVHLGALPSPREA